MMNKKIKELAEEFIIGREDDPFLDLYEEFAELIIKEHIKVLQQEWYNLNNDKDFDEQTRSNGDIRFRAGQKSEIVVLIEKIKNHWECHDRL